MNCKPGDLAMVVGGYESDNGKCVTVIALEDPHDVSTKHAGGVWRVDQPLGWVDLVTGKGYLLSYWPDSHLIPIRPDDLSDEDKQDVLNLIQQESNYVESTHDRIYEV